MCLTRQNVNLLQSDLLKTAQFGGYVILENEKATKTLIATGSEVEVCV